MNQDLPLLWNRVTVLILDLFFTAITRPRRPISGSTFEQFEQMVGETDVPGLDVQIHNNPLRAIFEESYGQLSESSASNQQTRQTAEPQTEITSESTNTEQREQETESEAETEAEAETEVEPEAEQTPSVQQNDGNTAATNNAPAANADVVIGEFITICRRCNFVFRL